MSGPRIDDDNWLAPEGRRSDTELEESFQGIFARHYRLVRTFFARRGFSEGECDDLTQETFLRVYRNLEGFRGESSLETWLFQVASNIYRNELRSRNAQKREATEVSLDGVELTERQAPRFTEKKSPLEKALTEERAEALRRAVAELPPQMRRCVELRVHQDLKYKEIAALMQVSVEMVKVSLHDARKRLKLRLSDYFTLQDL